VKREDTYRHKGMRRALVDLLRTKGISDERVLSAIDAVPRHLFFDAAFISHAYEDKAFQIGEGQTISQPYTVAYMTEMLQVERGMKVLEIGTGSGYQAAVLAEMKAKVYSIERFRILHDAARIMLDELGYAGIKTFFGDGYAGLPVFAPFDRIIVTAAAPHIPEALLQQLKPQGILVIPLGSEEDQVMLRIRRDAEGGFHQEEGATFRFVPMLPGKVF
jgi:protein-L-isoaspartate(D-aspartate) O-methyltransferase